MKSSKRIIQDFAPVGMVGFPQNVFTGARYPLLADFPNNTTLYWYRPGASGMQVLNGGVTLTQVGTPMSQPDYLGNIVQNSFTGTQRFTSADGAFGFTGSFSIGFWMYRKNWNMNAAETAISSAVLYRGAGSSGYALYMSNNSLVGWLNNTVYPLCNMSEQSISSGWHFIAWTRSASAQKIYIDNILVGVAAGGSVSAAGSLGIGDYSAGGQYLLGDTRLGDFIMHNGTEWTAAQVASLYAAMLPNHNHTQAFAGHQFELSEPLTSSSEVIALYKANSADILKDEKMTYPLTNNGGVVVDNGIIGLDNAWRFNGASSYLTSSSLFATAIPDKGIVLDGFFKTDNGRPAQYQVLFDKLANATNQLLLYVSASGIVSTVTYGQSATAKQSAVNTVMPSGGTPWYYIVFAWDVVYGIRIWINGVLECQDPTATTVMTFGSTNPATWGRSSNGSTFWFTGCMANFRIRNKIITQADVDIGYATRYPRLSNNNLNNLGMNVRPSGIATLEYQTNCPVVAQDSTYSYRKGFTMGDGAKAGDQILIRSGY